MNKACARGTWALVVVASIIGCGPERAPSPPRPQQSQRARVSAHCPARMVALPELHACVDRHEALIRAGRAEPANGVLPARKTSFDEARRACEAAGYRLCTEREWTRACAGPGTPRKFAYGDRYEPERCNTASRTTTHAEPLPGGARTRCVTPDGIYNLSGNVAEWTSGTDASGELRELRGGSFGVGEDDDLVACIPEDHQFQPLDASFDGYGLRCCTSTR